MPFCVVFSNVVCIFRPSSSSLHSPCWLECNEGSSANKPHARVDVIEATRQSWILREEKSDSMRKQTKKQKNNTARPERGSYVHFKDEETSRNYLKVNLFQEKFNLDNRLEKGSWIDH